MLVTDNNDGSFILSLFPSNVYCKSELLLSELDEISNKIYNMKIDTWRTNQLFVKSSHLTNDQLHTYEEFKILTDTIMREIKIFAEKLGYSEKQQNKFKFINMWFNQSGIGDYNFPHTHNGSLFSGVFYLKAIDENHIYFHDFSDISIEPEVPNNLSFRTAVLNCKPGTIYIFKSDLIHSNPRQCENGEKLAVSFNIRISD